jgi:hypothetical protein
MKPDRIDVQSDDGSEKWKNANLWCSGHLGIWLKQLFRAVNDNQLAWPFIPLPEDWYGVRGTDLSPSPR